MPESQIFSPQGPLTEETFKDVYSVPGLFSRLLALSMVRPSALPADTVLSNTRMTLRGRKMDPGTVSRFKDVCGYAPDGGNDRQHEVPAPYIQTLFIGVMGRFVGSSHFPITPMGLIQVGQSFTLLRPVTMDETLDLSCTLLDMTQTPRGITTRFDLAAESGGETVWQGIATNFTRAKHPPARKEGPAEDTPLPVREAIGVAADTGRRYAAVSGDYNPHHLYPWTAKFIGFKRAIAHGMWSIARTCASLEKAFAYPSRFSVDGALKLPVFLPGTVTLGTEDYGTGARFELRDKAKGLPHLKGTFSVL